MFCAEGAGEVGASVLQKGKKRKMSTFLADGFRCVDSAEDAAKLSRCLARMEDLSDFCSYKEKSFEALNLRPDSSVADVACGLGFDLLKLRRLVPRGFVTGYDISEEFVAASRHLAAPYGSVRVVQGDIQWIDCEDSVFDAVRIDRSLQHIEDPDLAISEMTRMTKGGGTVVAAEPDWSSYQLASDNPEISATVEAEFRSTIRNPVIGRQLVDFMCRHLEIQHHGVHPLLLRSHSDAEIIFDIAQSVQRCCQQGLIENPAGQIFLENLSRRSQNGTFFALLNIHVVSGVKR